MKNKELFDRTVKILVNAYLNNTLVHNNCGACAVGNIIAANMQIKYDSYLKWIGRQLAWSTVFVTMPFKSEQVQRPWAYNGSAKEQIDATGYSWQELALIEAAFESAPKNTTPDERMFNGLMAVVDVLGQIHDLNEETKQATKELFLKA
ncbi:hypothetical protein [Adhaeribacter rhizoryzae]|uniref:Uncharacterized protein n=1 Tax=Adhaeribacter rhizoryzae TaxID=2607907 RepID=A0A5M6DBV4_9BACT|nr:hypothetical protein [Adhaeribacter rhizoryzae]KAA5545017.1 hypothetical protein F0145_13255 [Adhaeribacter rhizoryzae]